MSNIHSSIGGGGGGSGNFPAGPYTEGDLFYASDASTVTELGIGAEGENLVVSSSSLPEWRLYPDPAKETILYEDFAASNTSSYIFTVQTQSSGSLLFVNTVTGRVGIARMNVNANAASNVILWTNTQSPVTLNAGGRILYKTGVNPVDLSDASDEYWFFSGFADNTSAGAPSNGIYFSYDRTSNTNWEAITISGGTATTTDTGVAVATSTWYDMYFDINAVSTSIDFYINGSNVATHTTNIPTNNLKIESRMLKSSNSGVTKSFDIDYMYVYQKFSSDRG